MNSGHDDQHDADRDRADRVVARVAGRGRERDEHERDDEARQRGDVLAEHDDEFRVARVLQPVAEGAAAADLADLVQAADEAAGLEHDRDAEHREREPQLAERLRLVQLVPAFVDREQPADAEEQQRDDEAPEVRDLAVAERMLARGRLLGLLQPEEQQHLVRAVRVRVDRLGEHAARVGVGGCAGLGDRRCRSWRGTRRGSPSRTIRRARTCGISPWAGRRRYGRHSRPQATAAFCRFRPPGVILTRWRRNPTRPSEP